MSIRWSWSLLEQLLPPNLNARLFETQVDPHMDMSGKGDGKVEGGGYMVPFYNGKTGTSMKEMPMKNSIRYGKKISIIEKTPEGIGITAHFKDDSQYSGAIIVGTDSAKSKVREVIMGEEAAKPRSMDIVLYNVNVCYGDAEKSKTIRAVHPIDHVVLHPEEGISVWTSIQSIPSPDDPATWEFQVMPSWKSVEDNTLDDAGRLARLKEIAHNLAEPWKSELLWIPEGTPVADNAVSYWTTAKWDNLDGRVTLAGDAAHPMLPHRGQGLNHCTPDAINLMNVLKSVQEATFSSAVLKDVIGQYDAELLKRGSEEVQTSLKSAIFIHQKMMEAPVLNQGYTKG